MDEVNSVSENRALQILNGIDRSVIQFEHTGVSREFENLLSEDEQLDIEEIVLQANRTNQGNGRTVSQSLGRDDYLKLLITQLQNQDPTSPLEDREFISQMAQFSSLEQITNLSQGFQNLASVLSAGQATSMLGKIVEISANGTLVNGVVSEITRGEFPQLLVDNVYYDLADVLRVRESSEN